MINIYTQGNVTDKEAGRPKKDDTELTDSGLAARDRGSNIGRGGKQ